MTFPALPEFQVSYAGNYYGDECLKLVHEPCAAELLVKPYMSLSEMIREAVDHKCKKRR